MKVRLLSWIAVVSMMLLLSCQGYSQRIILDEGDSLVCNTLPQTRFLLKEHYKADYLSELNKELYEIIDILDSSLSVQKNQTSLCDSSMALMKAKEAAKDSIISGVKSENELLRKENKKEKVKTKIAGGSALLLLILLLVKT